MKKIFTKDHLNQLTSYPLEVLNIAKETMLVLDEAYGAGRDMVGDLGGYIIFVENREDFKTIKQENFIDLECDAVPEFTDLIKSEEGKLFTNSLILLSSDFSISVIIPLEITPDNLKRYIIE